MSKYIEVHSQTSGNRILVNCDEIIYFAEGKYGYNNELYCELCTTTISLRISETYEQIKDMLNE